jgi:hypothetical protein
MDQRRRPRFGADSETGGNITTDAGRKVVSLHRGRGLSKTFLDSEAVKPTIPASEVL